AGASACSRHHDPFAAFSLHGSQVSNYLRAEEYLLNASYCFITLNNGDHMDRLQSLRIFVAIAETESFAAGARAFGLSAPSATRAVNILEESLGTRLFTRTTRRVRLTEVGQAYLHDVREALAALQVADETASGAAQAPIGELRITCPQEFGRIYVVPILMEFLDLHPQITAE